MQTVTRKVNVRPGMVTRTVLDGRNGVPENVERARDRNPNREEGRPEEVRPPKPRNPEPRNPQS